MPIEAARLCRDLIAGSVLVELDSDIHLIWLSDVVETITNEIERFVQKAVLAAPANGSVVLATILAVDPETMAQPERRAVVADIVQRGGGRVFAQSGVVVFDRPSQAISCGTRLACVMADPPGVAVHSGECEITATAVRGVAVDLVVRIAASARPAELVVTRTIRDLVAGSDLAYERRPSVTVDGSSEEWQTFAVTTPVAPA